MKIMFFHEVYECKKVKPHHMMILVGSRKRKKDYLQMRDNNDELYHST